MARNIILFGTLTGSELGANGGQLFTSTILSYSVLYQTEQDTG